jgi:hypothetical protein
MLIHLVTTTSEREVQDYLKEHSQEVRKAFVLTTKIPDDDINIRYDIFKFVKEDRNNALKSRSYGFSNRDHFN